MNREDAAVRGYECPVDRCKQPPGQRCRAVTGSRRVLMHPHRPRVALVARPVRGPSDHALASWLRSHAAAVRFALDYAGRHGGEESAFARLSELERLLPPQEAGG